MSEYENNEIKRLEDNLKSLILGTCNTVGCKDCGQKYLDGDKCQSDIYQDRIFELKSRTKQG